MNDRNVRLVLARLSQLGVVLAERAGNSGLYTLNRKHTLFATVIDPIFRGEPKFRQGIFADIRRALRRTGRFCRWAGVIGSVARGFDGPKSDLDLLILVARQSDSAKLLLTLELLRGVLLERYGVVLDPLIMTVSEWNLDRRVSSTLRRSVREQHVALFGDDSKVLL